jgi:hypothetical protein
MRKLRLFESPGDVKTIQDETEIDKEFLGFLNFAGSQESDGPRRLACPSAVQKERCCRTCCAYKLFSVYHRDTEITEKERWSLEGR